jgi:GR25 family glycosyltransferase involved in LPS biosynthesis
VLSEPLQDNQNVSEYKSSGYTIVLEDDVRIDTDDLQSEVSKIIKSIEEFDIVFFGNLKENHGQH